MPKYADDDDIEDDDWPDDSDDLETIPCPECGAEIYEDSPHCPMCGHYIIPGESAPGDHWRNKPLWYTLLAFAGIGTVVVGCLFLF